MATPSPERKTWAGLDAASNVRETSVVRAMVADVHRQQAATLRGQPPSPIIARHAAALWRGGRRDPADASSDSVAVAAPPPKLSSWVARLMR